MKLDKKLEVETNIRAWKSRINLILAKEDLLEIVQGKVTEPKNKTRTKKYKKYEIPTLGMIVEPSYSIHLNA